MTERIGAWLMVITGARAEIDTVCRKLAPHVADLPPGVRAHIGEFGISSHAAGTSFGFKLGFASGAFISCITLYLMGALS